MSDYARLQIKLTTETENWGNVGLSSDDYRLPVAFNTAKDGSGTWYTPLVDASGHLQVDLLSGGGGTQYTEGDTDASITGMALMWEDAANTLVAASATKPLPVDLGSNNDVTVATLDTLAISADDALGGTPSGIVTLAQRDDALSALTPVEGDAVPFKVDANGALWTTLATALDETNDAIAVYGSDDGGTTMRIIKTDSGGAVQVDIESVTPDLMLGSDFSNVFGTASVVDGSNHLQVDIAASSADVTSGTHGNFLADVTLQLADTDVSATNPVPVRPNEYELAGNTTHVKKYYTSATPTDGIVWSPAAGKRWYITDIFIGVSAASTVTLEDDLAAGDDVVWKHELAANSGWDHTFETPLYSGEDAADLIITATAGTVYVMITGYEI